MHPEFKPRQMGALVKIVILSDIHGNLAALDALNDCDLVGQVICLPQ